MYVLCGRCYEEGSTGSMAEEDGVYELEELENQLQTLLSRYTCDELRADSKPFCSDFCKVVKEFASRWQVPLPQLRILNLALCFFARASTVFTSNCEHVLQTISSLALSVFELLLFFDQKDLHQEPLKQLTVTFQECSLALARHQNVHLLQVERLVRENGPWASVALQAILSGSILPQSEVDGCISSELPVFFELRLRYLLSCERVSEAMALAKCCAWHPTAGQHLFFLQVYLTWLLKTSQHDILHKEVADLNGKYAVHIICSLECEEQDELLLALSRVFLCEQLCRGDMYYLCDLVFIWGKLHHRLKTPQNILLEEIRKLMLSATNVNSIFPFIRAILQEVGEDGTQFCVELCVNALECCLPCDVITKSLIYKTIAGLLPNDLEVCRACALLIFFLERTVDAYKTAYLLYMHPDQEYPVENSPIRNHIRFETLQVLKKDLCFDPEFWNLIALRTSCLRMMTEKVVSSALEEIMEDKWILTYCTKEPALSSSTSVSHKGKLGEQAAKKQCEMEDRLKEDSGVAPKRLKLIPRKTQLNVDRTVKRKRNPSSQTLKGTTSEPLRRSFWQLDRLKDNKSYEDRRVTRLSEKNPPKRRIRTPKWLLEDSGTLEKSNVPSKIKRQRLKHQKHLQSSANKRSETAQIKNNGKDSPCLDSVLLAVQTYSQHQKEFSLDCLQPASPPQVILELSLPDNELVDAFTEDTCNRQRGLPQVLLYKPTVKLSAATQPVKNVHRREVILRARDATMFVQQLHSYTRQLKGKGNASNVQGSVSTITRSSVQGSPPKGPQKKLGKKPIAKKKDLFVFPTAAEVQKCQLLEQDLEAQTIETGSQKTSPGREHSKMSTELKGTIASRSAEVAEMTESPVLLELPQDVITEQVLQTSTVKHPDKAPAEQKAASVSQIPAANKITEAPVLEEGRRAETKEHCEESTVEMKVTIASQTSTANETPGLDKVSKSHTVKNLTETIISDKISTASFSLMEGIEIKPPVNKMPNISNVAIADSNITHSQKAKKKALELRSCSSQCDADCPEVVPAVDIGVFDTSAKLLDGHLPLKKDTGAQGATPLGSDCKNNISALRFGKEMGTEIVPETQTSKQSASEVSVSNESTYGSKPNVLCKSHTTSSSPVPEQGFCAFADVEGKKGSDDFVPETSENREPVESEESKLEFCCTFCKKVFNGSRVVAHAMFHFRKDECMFCGTIFKDDLLAMMHLSDHIEKLKKNKDSAGNKVQERQLSDTKDISVPKTSSKTNVINMSSGHHRRGRPRKISVCNKSVSLPDSNPSGPRNLRSSVRSQACPSLQETTTQNASKNLNSSTPGHQINGHMAKKKVLERLKMVILNSKAKQPRTQKEQIVPKNDGSENPKLEESKDVKIDAVLGHVDQRSCCSTTGKDVAEAIHVLKTSTKHNGKTAEEKIVEPQEKLCCPVDGCTWFTDLSKNRVTLLYHALEDHCGDIRPLELAFRIGNSKCSICMRVLWSFEHFQHHVERHRLAPRHPCLHQGCTARFKTGIEMRRHTRRHSPLQAMCCLPGCSQLFICLWALNLHEREHYASKPTKPDKSSNKQTCDKSNMPSGKKQQDPNHKTIAVDENISVKAARQSTGEAAHTLSEKHIKVFSATNVQTSLMKPEVKESSDSHVLKNLSNKDTSAQSTGPTLRMRHNVKVTDMSQKYNTALKSHKVVSSSLLKHRIRVRNKFKKKQIKMNKLIKTRGHPLKSKKVVHDENTTGQDSKTVKAERDQRSQAPLECPSLTAETSNVSKKLKVCENIQVLVKTTEGPIDDSKSKKLINKKLKRKRMKQNGMSHNTSTPVMTESSGAEKMQKAAIVKSRKLHKAKKRLSPKESIYTSSETSKSKKLKVISDETEKPYPLKEKELVMSNSVGPQVETKRAGTEENCDGEEKRTENINSMQKFCDELPAPPTNSGAQTTEKSKKLHITQQPTSESKMNKEKTCIKEGDKTTQEQPGKDVSKTSLKRSVESGPVDHQVEATDSSPSSLKEFSPPSIANGENRKKATTKEKSKKPLVMKNTDPNKASRKHKVTKGEIKVANKRCKDQGAHKICKEPEVKGDVLEASEVEEGKSSVDTSRSVIKRRSYSLKMNGQAATEDKTTTLCIETLAEYGKKPYMRPPPTAYLDEKYTTMPKRRKEMMFSQLSERIPQQEETTATLQRQRCANCFATFSSSDDLQVHLHLRKCSNLFGFDSDDEGNG